MPAHQAYRVYLHGKQIDTVFYTPNKTETIAEATEDVRRSLINHDGYDPAIRVVRERPRKER